MAKKITLLKAGNSVPFADSGLKLSKLIPLSEIEEHDDFKTIFTIDEELCNRLSESMKENGFDNSQPVHIWKKEEDGVLHNYLIDGYTRRKAALKAGLEIIPFYEHNFETFEEAYRYVLRLQVDRRNLGDADLLRNIQKLYGTDFVQNSPGKKSEVIGEILHVSGRTVEKGLHVLENSDEEVLDKIDNQELSINKAYKDERKKKEKELERNVSPEKDSSQEEVETNFDISDSLSDNSGNIAPLSFTHSDGITRPSYKLDPEIDDERTRERRRAYENGYSDGVQKAVHLARDVFFSVLSELKNGKSIEEIESDPKYIFEGKSCDEILEDLSVTISDADGETENAEFDPFEMEDE